MADDSDGEYIDNYSDDDFNDHQVTSGTDRETGLQSSLRGARGHPTSSHGGGGGGSSRRARDRGKKARARAAWEEGKFTWDIPEDEEGNVSLTALLEAEKRRRLLRDTTPLQRGIIRHLVLVLDWSTAMLEKDLLPNRFRLTLNYAVEFIREYFEQNPISQMGVVVMWNGIARRVSDMSGNPAVLIDKLREFEKEKEPEGDPSLQNALEMCRGELFHAPSHGTREVLIIYGALLSSDPGDIHDTINNLIADRIRVSMVGLAAQVAICAELCSRTNGGDDGCYSVAKDEQHFRELFLAITTPPVTLQTEQSSASLLMMGFPSRTKTEAFVDPNRARRDPKRLKDAKNAKAAPKAPDPKKDAISFCACHHQPCREGYLCTRCSTKVCRLPAECPACGLTLILSTHLARSYHHLFPLRNWVTVSWGEAARSIACYACLTPFPPVPPNNNKSQQQQQQQQQQAAKTTNKGKDKTMTIVIEQTAMTTANPEQAKELARISESGRYACEVCGNHFCIDCDVFAHEVVHNCPGCQSDTRATSTMAQRSSAAMDVVDDDGATAAATGNGIIHANGAMVVD